MENKFYPGQKTFLVAWKTSWSVFPEPMKMQQKWEKFSSDLIDISQYEKLVMN